jgi:hypothetical protein
MRRVTAVVAVLAGLFLLGFTVSAHLFSRSRDAEKISDAYRPLMSAKGLGNLRHGFDAVKAAGAQLHDEALPQLRRNLNLSEPQFEAYVEKNMPGIDAFNRHAPGVVALVDPVIGSMEAARGDYHRADQIPTGFLPLSSAPWLFVGIGLALVALGAFTLVRPTVPAAALLALAGLALVVAPLVIGIPGKVDAAVRVTKLGAVGLAPATGQKAVGATALFDGMANDVSARLAPALGASDFRTAYPALASFTSNWQGGISKQSHALSDSQVALAPTFANANRIPLRLIPWMFILPGALLALFGVASIAPAWRAQPVRVPVTAN